MNEEASALVIELAEGLTQFCDKMNPSWDHGFFRFIYERNHFGFNGSYVVGSRVGFLNSDMAQEISNNLSRNSEALFVSLGQKKGVFLLAVEANGSYNIKYDFENIKRWEITKANGGNGWPKEDRVTSKATSRLQQDTDTARSPNPATSRVTDQLTPSELESLREETQRSVQKMLAAFKEIDG